MESCEVLVVGGGPAGAACAWALKRAGVDVVVADGNRFPRDKVCAGWLTPQIIQELEIDRADYASKRVLQPFTGFRLSVLGSPDSTIEYDSVISYGIRRREFDHYLLERSGARLRLGERIRNVTRTWDTWVVGDSLRARVLVGAGGHFCPVARQLPGRREDPSATVMAQEMETWLTPDQVARTRTSPEVPELFFCRDLQGYGWCVRKGEFLNIGLGRLNEHHLPVQVERFLYWLKETGRVPEELAPGFHGHAYSLYGGASANVVGDGMLLVGDAAGLASDASGEGIRPAIESGLLAAQTIIGSRGDYGLARLKEYERKLKSRFGRRRAHSPATLLPASFAAFAAERLLALRLFSQRVVLDRWFLHRAVPALAV